MSARYFEVDPELLHSGADASHFASHSARKAAAKLNESNVPTGIFGDFDAAYTFSGVLSAGRDDHVQRLDAHGSTLGDIAGKAHRGAQRVVATDADGADALAAARDAMSRG